MLLHIFIAIIFGGLIFKPPKVKGDSSLLPALGGLLDPLSSTNPIDTLTSFNMLSSSGFSNLLGLSKLPNLTDFLKEISSLMPNATLCKMCQMNSGQLCEYYGFTSETYTITTSDGYILTNWRCYKTITQKQPVLLTHGMMDSSDTWWLTGFQSLAFNYVENGYDVHLINCRGNRYSRKHKTLDPLDPAFWHFSWYEMAIYDVPETIEKMRELTGSPSVQYVGHSQGATVVIALLSLKPEYNKIITHAGLLAPFTYMKEVGFPINAMIEGFYMDDVIDFEFLPHSYPQNILSMSVCRLFNGAVCNMGLNFILGPSYNQIDPSVFPMIFCHFPAGCSTRQLKHFGQEYHCGYFGGMMKSPAPNCDKQLPSFDLSSVTNALSLYYSYNDPHCGPLDIEQLLENLKNAQIKHQERSQFNHIDFIWGKNAKDEVYVPLIQRAATFAP